MTHTRDLRAQGYRLTRARQAIVDVLGRTSKPVTAEVIRRRLHRRRLAVNKTTVYRELAFLETQGMVHQADIHGEQRYFEMAREHHHHVVCVRCGAIGDVTLRADLSRENDHVARQTGFRILDHIVTLSGVCPQCQNS
ncbi:MAG: transcriptional repressor [Candidatus Kerfeldbacteria bacterium]|nr:transcriptional repressor [Candidatus Kerfeldbacteria bacterium]